MISPDGITWKVRSSGSSNELSGITYGNNTFVAVGNNGTILTSPDGITWTVRSSGTLSTLTGIAYGNNTFVAVEWGDATLTSPDGITWTKRPLETYTIIFPRIAYGNNTFVVVDNNGRILTSPNGIIWTERTSGTSPYPGLSGITYANNIFVAVGDGGTILTSPDGITWTERPSGTSNPLSGITYANNLFVAVGAMGTIFTSSNGITWKKRSLKSSTWLEGIAYGNKNFVALGLHSGFPDDYGTILTSPNGKAWTEKPSEPYSLSGITYGKNTFVAVGGGGTILTSPDGITWTERSSGTSNWLNEITYANNTFVAVGYGGIILQSDPLSEFVPHPTVVTPTAGTLGTELTITGSGFGAKRGKVRIGKVPLTVLAWTDGSIHGRLTKVPTPGTYEVTIQPIEPKGAASIVVEGGFTVNASEIVSVDPHHGLAGDQIVLGGRFLGTTKGKVYLGYESKGKPRKKSCKVLNWTMNPATNEGEIEFVIPKGLSPGDYDLIVSNGVGSVTLPNGFTMD